MYSLWGLAAAAALLWPDRISGPFDGVPLDRITEAILIAGVLPALWYFHPRFLRSSRAHACILLLVVWRIGSALLFAQDGWCVRFEPARPFARDGGAAPHAWDLRADWRAPDPACSAVMTRSYRGLGEFPAWFFNLPPPNDSWPTAADRPPGATVAMHVHGFVSAPADGALQIDTGPDVHLSLSVDGIGRIGPSPLARGVHFVAMDGTLTGNRWSLVPRWNGEEIWARVTTTVRRPSSLDLAVRPWIGWIPTIAASALLTLWLISAVAEIADVAVLAWSAGASLLLGGLVLGHRAWLAPWVIAGLAIAALVPVPARLRDGRGAFVMIGIPWMTFVLASSAPAIGRFTIYEFGHDYWMYQRFAYRIVMQGYWLEGGSIAFYFQAFYRWIVGLLHVVFGDSSVGEWYWDGACLLAGATFSFRLTRAFAGFRWGLIAAVCTLAVFVLGTAHYLIGYGLGEISSAGLLSMAALCAISSHYRRAAAAVMAGVLVTIAFYTRLNNLIMAAGVALFALPLDVSVRSLLRPAAWRRRIAWRTAAIVPAVLAAGLALLAWRNWHYGGAIDPFYGTQRYTVSVAIWQPGEPLGQSLRRLVHSVMMVLTVNDPPRFDVFALPILAGAMIAVLSVAGVPKLRDLPAAIVLFFFASIASAFIAAGWAYTGRFSIHVMPVTCALAVCGLAQIVRGARHSDKRGVQQ